jgi:aminomethyltransferase
VLRGTPLHARTSVLCQAQNWRPWSGYLAAGSYELHHDREYWAIRSAAALIDVSPIYKYLVRGPDALRLLNRVVTRDLGRCAVGQIFYTPWCNAQGKVIDDGLVARLETNAFRLTSAEPNLRWLTDNALGLEVDIDDESERLAALALQGPVSRRILSQVVEPAAAMESLGTFRLLLGSLGGIPATITRTGYTGDLGYEIWIEAARAVEAWDLLLEVGEDYGLLPAGLLALDLARVEAGLILIEVDYVPALRALAAAQTSSPFELNLGWAVDLDVGPFNGWRALRQEKQQGSEWQFVGLELDWQALESLYAAAGLPPQLPSAAWRGSAPVYDGGRQVGYATSGAWSPLLKRPLALAHLQARYAQPGTLLAMEVTVEHYHRKAAARVVALPILDPGRRRA